MRQRFRGHPVVHLWVSTTAPDSSVRPMPGYAEVADHYSIRSASAGRSRAAVQAGPPASTLPARPWWERQGAPRPAARSGEKRCRRPHEHCEHDGRPIAPPQLAASNHPHGRHHAPWSSRRAGTARGASRVSILVPARRETQMSDRYNDHMIASEGSNFGRKRCRPSGVVTGELENGR